MQAVCLLGAWSHIPLLCQPIGSLRLETALTPQEILVKECWL